MTANPKYHVVLEDDASGETLGLLLTEGAFVGRTARLSNPYAAKVGGGDRALSDLTDFSVYGQTEWRGGRGQDRWEDEERFLDARGLETRIKGQVTLGPLSHVTPSATVSAPFYHPEDYEGRPVHQLSASKQERSMMFTVGAAADVACTHAYLLLRKAGTLVGNWTVTLHSDDGANDLPGTALKTDILTDADVPSSLDEVRVGWASQTLTKAVKYHLSITPPSNVLSETNYIEWGADSVAGYSAGAGGYKPRKWTVGATTIGVDSDTIDEADWTAEADYDFWFRINSGDEVAGAITVNPVRFNSKWYMAADDTVYEWQTDDLEWDSSEEVSDEDVTALLTWGDYLWAARGANTMRRMNTSDTWGDAPGSEEAEHLAEHQGYLYKSDPTTKEQLKYTSDGTTWSSAISVGPGDWPIRGIAGFRDQLAIANDVGLWLLSADWAYQVLDWKSLEDSTNGAALLTWARTNELFINVGQGLYRWTGSTMVSAGPDQDTGLPPERAGKVTALCGTVNWLFAAVDGGALTAWTVGTSVVGGSDPIGRAGTALRSSVLAYNGGGWHEVARAQADGERIRALGYETLSSPPRLWYGEGNTMRYVELPDYSDNPYAYEQIAFAGDGQMELSSWGSELLPVVKEWRYVVAHCENCGSGREIAVSYEVDRTGLWMSLGTLDDRRVVQVLSFPASDFGSRTIGTGSTATVIELAQSSSGIALGDWVRISDEIRQVAGVLALIADAGTLELALPLSSAPSAGDVVYATRPAGSEIRLRVRLVTDDADRSPKLLGIALYCEANVVDRWLVTVEARVEDNMRCLDGSAYPLDAATLATRLETWITRQTAFLLHDIRGTTRTVKIANAVELQPKRDESTTPRYATLMRLGFIELEVEGG